jgi:WD40 repeat protein
MISEQIGNTIPVPKVHVNTEMILSLRKSLVNVVYKPYELADGRIVTCDDQRNLQIIRFGDVINEWYSGHTHSIRRITAWEGERTKYNKIGTWIISAGSDGHVHLFDTEGKHQKSLIHGHLVPISCLMASPHNFDFVDALVYTGATDGTIKIWGIKSGKVRHTLSGHSRAISAMSFVIGRDHTTMLASVDRRDEIRLWDQASGECVRAMGFYEEVEKEAAHAKLVQEERELHEERSRLNLKKRHDQTVNLF